MSSLDFVCLSANEFSTFIRKLRRQVFIIFFLLLRKEKKESKYLSVPLRHPSHVKGCQRMQNVISASYFIAEVAL